jgi:hypothetical protein
MPHLVNCFLVSAQIEITVLFFDYSLLEARTAFIVESLRQELKAPFLKRTSCGLQKAFNHQQKPVAFCRGESSRLNLWKTLTDGWKYALLGHRGKSFSHIKG